MASKDDKRGCAVHFAADHRMSQADLLRVTVFIFVRNVLACASPF